MTKKTSPPPLSTRHMLWFGWKIVIVLSISLCVLALLRLQHYSQSELSSSIPRRSRILNSHFEGPPKIAFLFLVRRNLPLDFLWGSFFENADVANFSIYIHSEPGFVFDESTTRSPFFYNRQLTDSIKVEWGEASMIQAERLLLGVALEDPANQRFVLLSDSCVPLYNFSYIYSYLMASQRSFVDSFLDKKEGRYNPKMSPFIPKNKWRKGSQWISLVRSHAEVVADDEIVFPVFKKFCKRRPPVDASKGKQNIKLQKKHNCIPDEHYVQTLFADMKLLSRNQAIGVSGSRKFRGKLEGFHAQCDMFKLGLEIRCMMSDLEGELERRTVTYTLWNQSTTNMESKGWHPIMFTYANAGPQQIKRIKDINHVYYETEFRTEWCSNNSRSVPCFLFARKFSQAAAMRLLSGGVVSPFDASALLDAAP